MPSGSDNKYKSLVFDIVWAVARQKSLSLSKLRGGESTRTLKVKPPLFLIKLPLECSAFGMSTSLSPYYQAEENYEEKDSILGLVDKSLSSGNCTELWEPIVNEFLKVRLEMMLELLKPIEMIKMNLLKDKLRVLAKEAMVLESNKQIIINCSAMLGTLIFITAIVAAICKFRRDRRMSNQLEREMSSSVL